MRKHFLRSSRLSQSGAVLLVSLVMLGIFLVIVTGLVTTSTINFKIVGNQQFRAEAKMANRTAIESYLSNGANFQLPLPNSKSYVSSDFDGDGAAEMTAEVDKPVCLRAIPVPIADLELSDKSDSQCFGSSQSSNPGILTDGGLSGEGNSWCSNMYWDVKAEVNDGSTGAKVEMHQGVFVRTLIGTPCYKPAP